MKLQAKVPAKRAWKYIWVYAKVGPIFTLSDRHCD